MARRAALLLALVLAAGALAAEPLRVGLAPEHPPLAFRSEGRIVGLEADNARTVGEILSRPVTLVPLAFAELIPALLAGRIDVIMSGMSITEERQARVRFTAPYLRTGQMAILLANKVVRFGKPWAKYQPGARIGVEADTTGEAFAQREFPDAEVHAYPAPEAAFAALREDAIDLFIHDATTSWQLARDDSNRDMISLYRPLTEERLAWAVAPANTLLQQELDRALSLMRANGTLNYIVNRWIPVQVEVR